MRTVSAGRQTDKAFERAVKMVAVGDADLACDFARTAIGREQQMLRLSNAPLDDILHRRQFKQGIENMNHMAWADMKPGRQLLQGQVFPKMFV